MSDVDRLGLHLHRLKLTAMQARYAGATHDQLAAAVRAGTVAADRERLRITVLPGGRT